MSANQSTGQMLLDLCRGAHADLLIVAPFIKQGALARLLAEVDDNVSLRVVTRWKVKEVLAGVSDLEVYPMVAPRGRLFLRQDLHAKYFRADRSMLVGSANVTATGLGWSRKPNLELLVTHTAADESLAPFEEELMRLALPVSRAVHSEFVEAVEGLHGGDDEPEPPAITGLDDAVGTSFWDWSPSTRQPEYLYTVYSARDPDGIPRLALAAGRSDLEALEIPEGLSELSFARVVRAALITMPIVMRLDMHLSSPRRFGEIRSLLREWYGLPSDEASLVWQNLIRWFRVFAPDRYVYTRPRHSELIALRSD